MQKQQQLCKKDFDFHQFSNHSFCYSIFGHETLYQEFPTTVLWTFRARSLFVVGPVLCILGCLAASLASTH